MPNTKRGFTLIEMIVVIGIFILLISLPLSTDISTMFRRSFRDEESNIISALQNARSEAMRGVCLGNTCAKGLPHGIHFEEKSYTLFQGALYNPEDPQNETVRINPLFSIHGLNEVIFIPLSGEAITVPEGEWNVVLINQNGESATTTLNSEGRINSIH